ncbi:MAG: hypothetical protein AAGG56_08495 [Pseudomonadota bacterium]
MEDILVLMSATLVEGVLVGLTEFGFALAAMPLYRLLVPRIYALVVAQSLQIAAAPVDIVQKSWHIDCMALALLFGGALVGAPIVKLCATRLPPDPMQIATAVLS